MKKIVLAAILLSFSQFAIIAQENTIAPSQLSNVAFIHVSDLSNFSQAELDLLHGNYIVFEGELTTDLVQNHIVANKSIDSEPEQSLKPEEQQFVKNWLAAHQNVKIVTGSAYEASPENIRNEYFKSRCLMLKGEIVTQEDILNY